MGEKFEIVEFKLFGRFWYLIAKYESTRRVAVVPISENPGAVECMISRIEIRERTIGIKLI